MSKTTFITLAQQYWQLRDQGDVSDRRSALHNDILDALNAAGIAYDDREHAAQIALAVLRGDARYDAQLTAYDAQLTALKILMVKMDAELHRQFKMRCAAHERNMQETVRALIQSYLVRTETAQYDSEEAPAAEAQPNPTARLAAAIDELMAAAEPLAPEIWVKVKGAIELCQSAIEDMEGAQPDVSDTSVSA